MSKNKVWVFGYEYGGWFVGVDVGRDTLLAAKKGGTPGYYAEMGGRQYQRRLAALRAAHRIGKALGLPVSAPGGTSSASGETSCPGLRGEVE